MWASLMSPAMARSPQSEFITKPPLAQKIPSKLPGADNRDTKLADAASINEDLIDFSLVGKADKVAEKVTSMRKALATLRPLLDDKTFETLGRQVNDMEQASSKNDVFGTALAAVETYRTLEKARNSMRRSPPFEVAMMDYSGFKLSILASGAVVDWATILATAKQSDGSWSALTKIVQDGSTRNLVGAIQDGLRGAIERKDIQGVKFAAKMQLGVVDVLEEYFKRQEASRFLSCATPVTPSGPPKG
jgi:hypothetical protein